VANLEEAWKQWTSTILASKIFPGLPAAPQAAGGSFIPAANLTSKVLPNLKGSKKYSGIMLWPKYHGDLSDYSASIKGHV